MITRRRNFISLPTLAIAVAASFTAFAGRASPLPARDQNPLLSGFEVPSALPATLPDADAWTFESSLAWGSSAIVQANPRETLIVDAETRELRVVLGRGFANGYAFRVELPYRHTSAGSLDSFIDEWHDVFGLPEGARPDLQRDALRISYERDGARLIDERSRQSGIGDLSLQLGKQLGSSPLAAWISAKLPTGDAESFTGNGGVNVAAALAFERSFGGRYTAYAQAAGTWLGDGDRLRAQQEEVAWSALAGISARVFESISLTAQVDAHTAIYDSKEDFLGEAVMLTLGGTYRIGERWRFSFGVTEDIAVESTSDVVFLFQIKAH